MTAGRPRLLMATVDSLLHSFLVLGLPGIEEGAPADLVAYRDDPRADPEVLRRPALCILNGREIN